MIFFSQVHVVKSVLMVFMAIQLVSQEKFNFVKRVIVTRMLMKMQLEIVTEPLENVSSVFTTLLVRNVMNVFQDISVIPLHFHMAPVKVAHVIPEEPFKHLTVSQFAIM